MKNNIINIILLISILYPYTSYSNDNLKRIIPDGKTIEINGEEGIFFTLEEYRIIGFIYNDYIELYDKDKLVSQKYNLMIDVEKNHELRLNNCKEYSNVLEIDRNFWKSKVEENNKIIKSIQKSNKIKNIIHMGLVGVLSVSNLILVLNK